MNARASSSFLLLAMLCAIGFQFSHLGWVIDDAGISFAYARHLAQGDGLVAVPGGERVEGYSNPLWVALLAIGEFLGASARSTARVLGALLSALTIPLVWRVAIRTGRKNEWIAAGAVLLLLANAQFAIWNASGLENPLFNLLVASSIWCLLREYDDTRTAQFPWSAVSFLALSLTRPEGVAYSAIGLMTTALIAYKRERGLRPVVRWALIFWIPVLMFEAARLAYFAWPLPNPSYVKLDDEPLSALDWRASGWHALRAYASFGGASGGGPGLGQGYLFPVYVLGAVGWAARRRVVWLTVAAVLVALTSPEWAIALGWENLDVGYWLERAGFTAVADYWPQLRVPCLAAVVVSVGFASFRRVDGVAGAVCWSFVIVGIAFAALAGRDWMAGFRWLAMICVPGSLLLAWGIGEILLGSGGASWSKRKIPCVGAALCVSLFLFGNLNHRSWWNANRPIALSSVERRAGHWNEIADQLQLERPTLLEVDVGAHLLDGRFDVIDLVGLTDVPIARHRYHPALLSQSLLVERRPDLAHVHGYWAKRSGLPHLPEWRASYLEVSGYGIGRPADRTHRGHYVRRDLLFSPRAGSDAPLGLGSGLGLVRSRNASGYVAPGGTLDVELDLILHEVVPFPGNRLDIELVDGERVFAHWAIRLGYGWLDPQDWRVDEVFNGRYSLALPADIAPGLYGLRIVGSASSRAILPELRVLDEKHFAEASLLELAELQEAARLGRCDRAESLERISSRRGRITLTPPESRGALARSAVANCWLAKAQGAARNEEQVALLVRARRYADVGGEWARILAAALADQGKQALTSARSLDRNRNDEPRNVNLVEKQSEIEAWLRAYESFSLSLQVDPSRSWHRRWAEEARARLLILAPSRLANRPSQGT